MKKIIILIGISSFFMLISSLNIQAQVFKMDVSHSMDETVLGAPLYIKIILTNVSGEEQKVSPGFSYDYILKDLEGKEVEKKPVEFFKLKPCENIKIRYLKAGWQEVKTVDINEKYRITRSGIYFLEIVAYTRCLMGINEKGEIDHEVWYGSLVKTIQIEVNEPIGLDREAYDYYHGNIPIHGDEAKVLLEKFPTSTYAGWVLWGKMHHMFSEDPKATTEDPERALLIYLGKIPFDSTPGKRKNLQTLGCGWVVNRFKDQMEKLVNKLGDGEPRDSIAECLAEEYLFHGNYEKAIPLFKISSTHPRAAKFLQAIGKHLPEYKKMIQEKE